MYSVGLWWKLSTSPCHSRVRRLAASLLALPLVVLCGPAHADDDPVALNRVAVTARKVEEDVLRVPASVQVVPGELIDEMDLSSLYALQFYVPGLVVTNLGLFGAGIALRGVTDAGGSSLSVAPHFNGVYLGQSSMALARLFDIERIEVLKGPQGTLYGRNATGGSINIIARPPGDVFSAALETAAGSFDTVRAEGHVNLPSDNFAVRLAVTAANGDGYIHNTIDDRKFAEQDYFGIRGSIRAYPTDRLTLNLTGQHMDDDGATGELWLPRKDNLPDPNDIYLTTVTEEHPYLSLTNDVVSAELAYEFDRAVFRSISGYARNETRNVDDCAGIPLLEGCVRGSHPGIYDQWSQEFHLASTTASPTQWLVGLFLLDAHNSLHYQNVVPLISPIPINDYSADTDDRAYAVFGQATQRISEQWSLNGGLRLSYERNHLEASGTGLRDNEIPMSDQQSWTKWSWLLGVQYAPGENSLLYASASTGFKSGGFTTGVLEDGQFDSFDPEDITAYEAGVNLWLPNPRWSLRASAFLYDFHDMQVRQTAIVSGGVTNVVDNASSARVYGLDVASDIDVSDRLTFTGGVVWLPKREFVDYQASDTGQDLSGNNLIRAPQWTTSASAIYRLPVGAMGHLTTRIDYAYRSKFFFTKENDPVESQDGFGLLNILVRLDSPAERWYVFAIARNVTDVDYFNQAFIQSSPGYPANQEIGFGLRF